MVVVVGEVLEVAFLDADSAAALEVEVALEQLPPEVQQQPVSFKDEMNIGMGQASGISI